MSPLHFLEFLIFSVCIHMFSIFTYLIYYYDLLKLTDEVQGEYDFLIVGSGTSGSLIAHRIATETNYTFKVLEAGARGHPFHDIPAFGPLLHGSVFDWQYETVPQENGCYAMENSKCKQIQGKILGGSSKLNNMIYVRGNTSHYVEWFHGKYTKEYVDKQFQYIESVIFPIDSLQYHSKLSDAVMDAAKELGFKAFNNNNRLGFIKSMLTQNKGKRWATSDNLDPSHVLTNVFVEKLLMRGNKCVGVQIKHPKRLKLIAKKGVIVSAGTFNSAKLLQLSGIGPAELLKSLNIPIVKELPVGKNLQDHVGTGLDLVLFDTPKSVTMFDIMNFLNVYHYFAHGNGPLTIPGCEVVGFVSTKNETTPNLQFMVLPVGISADRGSQLRKILGITDAVWNNYFSKVFDKYTATFLPLILHPKSRGEVKIQSIDSKLPPLIDPKYLSHADDIKILIDSIKIIKQIVETKAMKAIGAHLNTTPFPGCENYDFFSELYLKCYVKHLTLTSYHPVGTCSMGDTESNASVVDTNFKVFGIDNLYVVDGSVLPTLPSGNINAAIAMMANIFVENVIINFKPAFNLSCDNRTFDHLFYNICPVR